MPVLVSSPSANSNAYISRDAPDPAAANPAGVLPAVQGALTFGKRGARGGDNVDAVPRVQHLEETLSAIATEVLGEPHTVTVHRDADSSEESSSEESWSEESSSDSVNTGDSASTSNSKSSATPRSLSSGSPRSSSSGLSNDGEPLLTPLPAPLLTVRPVDIPVDARVTPIAALAATTNHDAQKVVLYVAERPGVVPVPLHATRPEAIVLTLSDGVVQIVSRWSVPSNPPYNKDNLPVFSQTPALLELQVLVLRRYGDGGETEEMRLVVVNATEVEGEVRAPRPRCWQLRGLPFFEPAMQAHVRRELDFDPPQPRYTCCDGTECSLTFQVAEDHTSSSDYGTEYDDYGDGEPPLEPGVLHVSCCVLRDFVFPPLSAMKAMNKYADKDIEDMDNREKRHLCYYYIARTVFRATWRLPLGNCIKTTVRTLYPPEGLLEDQPH